MTTASFTLFTLVADIAQRPLVSANFINGILRQPRIDPLKAIAGGDFNDPIPDSGGDNDEKRAEKKLSRPSRRGIVWMCGSI